MKQVDGTECLTGGDTRPPSQVSQTVPAALGRTLPPGSVHLGVSKEIAPTLRELGIDPDPVIREAGLDPHLFDDAMSVIPFAALGRLYTLCVTRTGCRDSLGQLARWPAVACRQTFGAITLLHENLIQVDGIALRNQPEMLPRISSHVVVPGTIAAPDPVQA